MLKGMNKMNGKKYCPFVNDLTECANDCALHDDEIGKCAFLIIAQDLSHYAEKIADSVSNISAISDSIDDLKLH